MSPGRARLASFILTLVPMLVGAVQAQTPSTVLVAKYRGFTQSSSVDVDPAGTAFGAHVEFAAVPAAATTVQLRGAGGATTLSRQSDGSYDFEQDFADVADLNTAFPDGTYTLVINGGASTTIMVATNLNVGPTRITNFDALQSWSTPYPTIAWERLPDWTPDDFLGLDVYRPNGQQIVDAGSTSMSNTTSYTLLNAPFNETLNASITYARFVWSKANNNATDIAVASGFALDFTLRCTAIAPQILSQPLPQVARIGTSVNLGVTISSSAQGTTFRLLKDGTPVNGIVPSTGTGATTITATFAVPVKQASDAGAYTIEITNPSGTLVTAPADVVASPALQMAPFVGSGTAGMADGAGTVASFQGVRGLAVDANGNLVAADGASATIRKITPAGLVTTIAGAAGVTGSSDGPAQSARFNDPTALAIDAAGNIFVADTGNNVIRRIASDGMVSTVAGLAGQAGSTDGVGSAARFRSPQGIAVDAAGNLYVADTTNATIRRIAPDGTVTTVAGRVSNGSVDPTAPFSAPRSLAVDPLGRIDVVDGYNFVRRLTPATGQLATIFAGPSGGATPIAVDTGLGNGGGVGQAGLLSDLAIDSTGTIFVAAWTSVEQITDGGSAVGMPMTYRDPLRNVDTTLYSPRAFARAADGTLYIADDTKIYRATVQPGSADPRLRIASQPKPQTIATGNSVVMAVDAGGPGLTYQWLKNGVGIGGATSATLLLSSTTAADSGDYSVLVGNGAGAVGSARAHLAVTNTSDPGRLANLSIRAKAGTDTQTLIVGLAVSGGTTGATKPVLIRGIGPALSTFGVPNALADPALTVVNGASTVAANDNWGGSATLANTFSSVGAFGLPGASQDAAIAGALPIGTYSVKITGNGGTTGVALAEIYDLAGTVPNGPRLINVSTRAQVGTGADVLIAGFAVGGATNKALLIRGVGPSLATYGVTGALADPRLEVYSGSTRIAGNDDWAGDANIDRASRSVGAFNFIYAGSKDAALLITLAPGTYTVQLSGVGGTTGVGLIEVYELP